MASSTSTVLRMELMTAGEKDGTWGTILNTDLGIVESAITGTTSVSTTGGTTTLTNVDYTNDQAKKAVLDVSGALVSNATIVIPNASKTYKVFNRTTGSYTLTVKTSSGTGITVTQSTVAEIYCDGSNTVRYASPITDYGTGAPATSSGAAASSVSVIATGNLSSTNAQAALAELQGDIDTINSSLTSSYQPLDSDLTIIAALAKTKGNLIAGTGTSWEALAVGTNGYVPVAKSSASSGVAWSALVPAGTVVLFYQASAPTGWTGSNTDSDKAIRIVSQTSALGGASGGTTAFTSVFTSRTISQANLPNISLTAASGGAHTHFTAVNLEQNVTLSASNSLAYYFNNGNDQDYTLRGIASDPTIGATSSNGAHTHSVPLGGSGTAMDFAVQYISVIKASKDAY